MKEAQERLTGDAFKKGHTGDELWGGGDRRQAVRATLLLPEPELHNTLSSKKNLYGNTKFRQWGSVSLIKPSKPLKRCLSRFFCRVFFVTSHFTITSPFQRCTFVSNEVPCTVLTLRRGYNQVILAKLTVTFTSVCCCWNHLDKAKF